jgi:hypothetical protein
MNIATTATGKPASLDAADVEALREKLLAGLTPFNDFARALRKHPTTLARMKPPTVRVGRRLYVPNERGRQWILDGCPPVLPDEARGRGRKRIA